MDLDAAFRLWKNEYLPLRITSIIQDLLDHDKKLDEYENFLRAFFRLETYHIEDYLLYSYKDLFIGRFFILYLVSDEIQQYRDLGEIQKRQENSEGNSEG